MPLEEADDLSTLERLRRKLYAPKETPAPVVPRLSVETPHESGVAQAWEPEPVAPVVITEPKKGLSWPLKFLIGTVVFFCIALLAGAYFLFMGGRAVSNEQMRVSIDGPTSIGSGDTLTLLISLENNNPAVATETMLSLTFPESARSPENPEAPYPFYEDTVGDIQPGGVVTRSVRVQLYGSENDRIRIPLRFEYRVPGSNALFYRELTYETTISRSPLSIRAEAVGEALAGRPLTLSVTVRSNADTTLENVAVLAAYPFGFAPRRGEGPVYPVGTLAPGEERTITVSGTLTGEEQEERVFRFSAGTAEAGETTLAASYASTQSTVSLTKPFIAVALAINNNEGSMPVIATGEIVQGSVSWLNALAADIVDPQITVTLSGDALDSTSVSTSNGFYRSSDRTIVFSRERDASLAQLAAGASGNGLFTFKTKSSDELAGMRNPTVTATVSVSGRRIGESNVLERVDGAITRNIMVQTAVAFTPASLYSTGAFRNTGPWPPVADQETTYTIKLELANTVNSVADGTVTGTLPSYVRYTGQTSGSGAVSYNAATRTVTWKAGELAPGVGYGTAATTAQFQVALLPSASQRGTSPVLMSGIIFTGTDRFTQQTISLTRPELTTQTQFDPSYTPGKETVR